VQKPGRLKKGHLRGRGKLKKNGRYNPRPEEFNPVQKKNLAIKQGDNETSMRGGSGGHKTSQRWGELVGTTRPTREGDTITKETPEHCMKVTALQRAASGEGITTKPI